MKNLVIAIVFLFFGFLLVSAKPYKSSKLSISAVATIQKRNIASDVKIKINDAVLNAFFNKYPNLKNYKSEVNLLYKHRAYKSVWYDKTGLIEFANLLYSKVNQLEAEGLNTSLGYKVEIGAIFNGGSQNLVSQTDKELLLSTMYVYYAKKVYHGIDVNLSDEIGWFIPRKNISFESLLDTLLINPNELNQNGNQLFNQYYKLRDVLKKYREIEQNNDWKTIATDSVYKVYKPDDSAKVIGQIRHRLYLMGDLKQDSKSDLYDEDLMVGVMNFKKRNAFYPNYLIEPKHIYRLNIPIEQCIKTIIVNMERCRWIDPEMAKASRFIIVNIPAFKLQYKKNGITEMETDVIVGKDMTETVIFSGNISQIVFSPYWNIPQSIVANELEFAVSKDKNYLAENNIEVINGRYRQKPGPTNPMGLVKFLFPNSNDIYLHDTPNKGMFHFEYKAYSHGCLNLNRAQELAKLVLKDDPDWTKEGIEKAMSGEKEIVYNLKNKIPIHIGYFTAWVNDDGQVNFYNDIYQRDQRLYELLFVEAKE